MNNKRVAVMLLATIVILAGVSISFAKVEYQTSLIEVYGAGSCATCHVNGSSDGPRTPYGTLFENQTNHTSNASAALKAIRAPPTANTTKTPTVTLTPAATATLTATPMITTVTATPKVTTVTEETPEDTAGETAEETPAPTKSPGFGIVVSLVGLFAWALIARRKN